MHRVQGSRESYSMMGMGVRTEYNGEMSLDKPFGLDNLTISCDNWLRMTASACMRIETETHGTITVHSYRNPPTISSKVRKTTMFVCLSATFGFRFHGGYSLGPHWERKQKKSKRENNRWQ
jgi:hypothetical protein